MSPTEPSGHPETGAWSNSSIDARSRRSSDETGRQRKRQRQDILLENCLRSVRYARGDRGHHQASEVGGLDKSPGDVHDRRRALKRVIDDALVEEAAARRKVHVARVRRDSVVGVPPDLSSGRPSTGFGFGTGLHDGGQLGYAGYNGQPPYREGQHQLEQRPHQDQCPQDDGELRLTDEEYFEMILRLEEELYQDFHGMGERGDQQCWDEMEDMDAAEIDAMVEAHLGEGSVNIDSCRPKGLVQERAPSPACPVCPVCRQALLQAHPGNPYFFYCPGSRPLTMGPSSAASLHPDVLLQSSHCAMDLSSEGIGLDHVGVRLRACERAHEASGCGGVLRFEVREGTGYVDGQGVPGAQWPMMAGVPRMLVAVCDGCGWGEVCL